MPTAIKIENVSKQYRLGQVGTGTLSHDLNRWWARIRGKEDPYSKVGQVNNREVEATSDYVWALNDINFEVEQGEILGIIGSNGAGKSTLLKLLSRVTAPTTGTIKTRGRIASLLEVGTGMHPEMTGRENIYMNGAILGMKRNEITKQLDDIVEFSGCAKYLDTPVKRYSSGMMVRLGFAVAAHLQCEILIVDEVLAVGDAEFRRKCFGKMKDVANAGRTVLLVSHDMQSISTIAGSCVVLDQGSVSMIGSVDAAIKSYLSVQHSEKEYIAEPSSDGTPRITKVKIKTSEPGNVHRFGEPLEVSVEVDVPFAIDGATFSFQIINRFGVPVTHAWVFDQQMPWARNSGIYLLTCRIEHPKLYLGEYSFRLHLSERSGGEKFEELDSVCGFEVVMHGVEREFKWSADAAVYLENFNWTISNKTHRNGLPVDALLAKKNHN